MKQQWDTHLELQQKFEKEVDRMIRVQDDIERGVVLGAQNLNTKKRLTKEEKKKFLSIYKDMAEFYQYRHLCHSIQHSLSLH